MEDWMEEQPDTLGPPASEEMTLYPGGDVHIVRVVAQPPVVLCVVFLQQSNKPISCCDHVDVHSLSLCKISC